jgi:hypothetical protein
MNRGCGEDFHSTAGSSLTVSVEQVCKLCKVGMESRKRVQGYYADRQMTA